MPGIVQRLDVQVNQAAQVSHVVANHPLQRRHADRSVAFNLHWMRRDVLRRAPAQSRRLHGLGPAAHRFWAHPVWISYEHPLCVVREVRRNGVNGRSAVPALEFGDVDPHVANLAHVLRILRTPT